MTDIKISNPNPLLHYISGTKDVRKTVTLLSASRTSELSVLPTKELHCTGGTSDVGRSVRFFIYNSTLANVTSCHAQSLLEVNTALEISDLNALAHKFYDFDEKVFEKKKIKKTLLFKK